VICGSTFLSHKIEYRKQLCYKVLAVVCLIVVPDFVEDSSVHTRSRKNNSCAADDVAVADTHS
jgi:hypothetical protein